MTMQSPLLPAADMPPDWLWAAMCQNRTSPQLSQMFIVRLVRVIDSATDRTMLGATEFVFADPKALEAGADDWLDVHDQIV
jgi:hypothetical protein